MQANGFAVLKAITPSQARDVSDAVVAQKMSERLLELDIFIGFFTPWYRKAKRVSVYRSQQAYAKADS